MPSVEIADTCTYILPDDFFEVVIVGGGTCGLAVASRLCEATPGSIYTEDEHQRFHWLRQREARTNKGLKQKSYTQTNLEARDILVLDAISDTFMGGWDRQFRSCQIPYLRSPMFFHPDPANIGGMITYAHFENREAELKEIPNVVGKEYSKHQLKRSIKKRTKKVPVPLGNHDKPGIVDINMRDYRDYQRPSTPLFRDFCQDVIDRYHLHNCVRKDEVVKLTYGDIHVFDKGIVEKGFTVTTETGKVYGAKTCVVASGHRGKISYPIAGLANSGATLECACHTTHIFNGDVSFPHPRVSAKRDAQVVIVGGGLTSAQLAHVLCVQGKNVTLVLRGPIKIKHFDFHLDWVTKFKSVKKLSFYMMDTDEERAQSIADAREGGLVNPEYHKKLKNHVQNGNLRILKYTTVENGIWCDESETWNLVLKTQDHAATEQLVADYVICATGIQADLHSLKFMESILDAFPIETASGFPCLTDHLQWNDELPLYMVGKNASLRVGPTSANLDGARTGAERVGWKIQKDRTPETKETLLQMAGGLVNWFSLLQEIAT